MRQSPGHHAEDNRQAASFVRGGTPKGAVIFATQNLQKINVSSVEAGMGTFTLCPEKSKPLNNIE